MDSTKTTLLKVIFVWKNEKINFLPFYSSASRLNTTDTSTTITNLASCEAYIFTVGIVGPSGIGNVSSMMPTVITSLSKKAPPKRLIVTQDKDDHLSMVIQWSASCPALSEPVGYIVSNLIFYF